MKKQEVFDYFCDRPEEEVLMVLEKLGLDVESEEFPEDVVEKAESVFTVVKKAAKALPPTKSEAIAVIDTAKLVTSELESSFSITIPQDVLFYLAHSAIQQLRADAKRIAELSQGVFIQTLQQEQENFYISVAQKLQSAIKRNDEQFNELSTALSNQQNQSPIFNVKDAIAELKKEEQMRDKHALDRKNTFNSISCNQNLSRKIDIAAFLKEVNGE